MTTSAQPLSATSSSSSIGFGRLLVAGLAGGAAAGALNLALTFGAQAAGVAFTGEFQPGVTGSLPLPMVFLSGVVMAVPASAVAWALQRYTANGARTYALVAAAFALISLGGPLNVAGLAMDGKVVMELMHVVAAVGIAGTHLRLLRRG
jgi:hypothetical protein